MRSSTFVSSWAMLFAFLLPELHRETDTTVNLSLEEVERPCEQDWSSIGI